VEAQPKKSTASAFIFFKELKPSTTILIDSSTYKKWSWKMFTFCLITLVASCQDIWKMPLIIYPTCFTFAPLL